MTDKQFEKIKKGLQFYSEGGIDNLCTMTETTLRTIIEDAIKEIEKENAELKADNDARKFAMAMSEKVEKQLREENIEVKRLCLASDKINEQLNNTIINLSNENAKQTDELKTLRESIKDYGAGCYEKGLRNGKRKLEEQLTKAKEIIKTYYEDNFDEAEFYSLRKKAEQFLSEVEK